MKKQLSILLAAVALLGLALTGCSDKAASGGVVNVYNWGVYIDESIFQDFEEQTGIKVNYDTYESNESMYGVLKNHGASYDIVIPSDYMISRMIDEDMLEKLDFENIPNLSDVEPALLRPEYDPTGEYSVPYMWGTVGIIYNTAVVTEEVTSWSLLFDERYAGQILMFNNSRDAFGTALKYLGYSYNTTDKAQIAEAVDLLVGHKDIYQSFVMDEIFDKLGSGEAAIGAYYAGDYFIMAEQNPDLAFCLPDEGSNLFVDAMCIPKGAENKANAEAFINFMCSTEAGLSNCEEIGYSTPLLSVRQALDPKVSQDPISYPDEDVLAKCESYKNLPQDVLDFYDSEWLRLKN